MPKKPVIVLKEPDLPSEVLLAAVGLNTQLWELYQAILRHPSSSMDEIPGVTPDHLASLEQLGLLRPSLERSLGFAPLPPNTAFSRLMTRHDEALLQKMRSGLQLRALMRSVKISDYPEHDSVSSGIEVYKNIDEARDRSYELSLKNSGNKQYLIDTQLRPVKGDSAANVNQVRAVASASLANYALNEYALQTVIVDATLKNSEDTHLECRGLQKSGCTILSYPGRLEQLFFRENSHFLVWEDAYPSRSGTVLVTAPWALRLMHNYFQALLPLCHPWRSPAEDMPKPTDLDLLIDLMAHGLTDEQISTRVGISLRTVGRHVAQLLTTLGASTRFEAGVLLERRRQIGLHNNPVER